MYSSKLLYIQAEKKRQEELKQQLEAELKQQQIALKMLKKANTTAKETANSKTNSSPKENHDTVHHKTSTSPKDLSSKLFDRVNTVHEDTQSRLRKASISPKDKETALEREKSPVTSDGKQSNVKHVGLLNLVRQRSPESKALHVSSLLLKIAFWKATKN